MKLILVVLTALSSFSLHAQYYYNDIIGTAEITERMKMYTANKVQSVTVTGFDQQGMKSTDFNEWQEVKENGKALKITTRNGLTKTILYYRFDAAGRLASLIDSSLGVQSVATYKYDATGKLIRIENVMQDTATEFNETEIHQWNYNAAGKPEKLWRILNAKDSTEIRFMPDEKGNVADEQVYKRGKGSDPVYYYYDDNNRLTDIVRFNKMANRLLPDIMFEYDDSNRVIQKITTLSSRNLGYLIWRYVYNDKGLKTKEALFDKDKQLTGKIDYQYSFGQ
ncbi:MAG TPA: hypothetical protein VF487_12340 [Chitinophagaceae bacterium]